MTKRKPRVEPIDGPPHVDEVPSLPPYPRKTSPKQSTPKQSNSVLAWLLVVLQAISIVIGATWVYTGYAKKTLAPTSAIASTITGPHAQQDACVMAAFYESVADLVEQDNQRTAPIFTDAQDLLETIYRAGHHTVGPGWSIGERYPQFVEECAKCLEAAGSHDGGEITKEDKSAIAAALHFIASEVATCR